MAISNAHPVNTAISIKLGDKLEEVAQIGNSPYTGPARVVVLRIILFFGLGGLYHYFVSMDSGQGKPFSDLGGVHPVASFRVVFGLKDEKPQAWDGQMLSNPNLVLEVEADRFRAHEYTKTEFSSAGVQVRPREGPSFPNDYLKNETSWVCSTREASMHGPTTEWHVSTENPKPVIQQPSVLIHLRSNSLEQPVHIKTAAGEFSFRPQAVLPFRASYFLDGNVRVESVPQVAGVSPERPGQQDFPSLLASETGDLWIAWQEYRESGSDSVLVRRKAGETWEPVSVLAKKSDVFLTALGEDARKRVWVVWSMQVEGNWDLYGRAYDGKPWSKQERLTRHPSPDIYHKVVTDSQGRLWLVWQRTAEGLSQIFAKHFDGKQWSEDEQVSASPSASGNNWWPAVTASAAGTLAVVWDGYASGSYDVYLRRREGNVWETVETVAGTARFESHPSVAIDKQNRVWVAWDESGIDWGRTRVSWYFAKEPSCTSRDGFALLVWTAGNGPLVRTYLKY